jgi:hypothetical protein
MGFLKLKRVGKYAYWYWCERKRAKKRQGASGRVKSIDLCLGDSLYSDRVGFYVWAGDIPIESFIDQVMPYLVSPGYASKIDFLVTLKPEPSVKLRAKPGSGIDLRNKEWAGLKRNIKNDFEDVFYHAFERVNDYLEYVKKALSTAIECERDIAEAEKQLAVYKADPERTWDHGEVWINTVTKEEVRDRNFYPSRHNLDEWKLYNEWSRYPEDYEERQQARIDSLATHALKCRQGCKDKIEAIVAMAPKDRQREARERLLREVKAA